MTQITSGMAAVEGGKLYYETSGSADAPALILLHAGVATLDMWKPQLEHFADRFRVVAYDVRGYGRTESADGKYSNRADLLALMDHLGIEQAIVVGCSRGGQIAVDFTLENPSRVRGIVLVGAGLTGWDGKGCEFSADETEAEEAIEKAGVSGDWDSVDALYLRMWYDGLNRPSEQVDPVFRAKGAAMLAMNRQHVAQLAAEKLQFIPLEPPSAVRLDEINVPVLLIVGELDPQSIHCIAEVFEKHIRGVKRVSMANTAHIPSLEHPAEFNAIVDDFLREKGFSK